MITQNMFHTCKIFAASWYIKQHNAHIACENVIHMKNINIWYNALHTIRLSTTSTCQIHATYVNSFKTLCTIFYSFNNAHL